MSNTFPTRRRSPPAIAHCARSLVAGVHAGVSHEWSCPNLAIAASLFFPSASMGAAIVAVRQVPAMSD